MSLDLVSKLSRADLLSVAAELSDDALKTALRSVLTVAVATDLERSQGSVTAAGPGLAKAPAAPAANGKAPKAPKAKPAAASAPADASSGDPAIDTAIRELAPIGFAMADLAAATGIEARAPKLKRAVDKAVEAGTLVKAGEKRFTRYGSTKAIAEAAKTRG